mmetsp:Transcript_12758/g.44076  ORF Transcript_12758/g.44076 Transcript_12758/m.44076 type:complete len:222 (-) Transcript_12758:583-1248(-)
MRRWPLRLRDGALERPRALGPSGRRVLGRSGGCRQRHRRRVRCALYRVASVAILFRFEPNLVRELRIQSVKNGPRHLERVAAVRDVRLGRGGSVAVCHGAVALRFGHARKHAQFRVISFLDLKPVVRHGRNHCIPRQPVQREPFQNRVDALLGPPSAAHLRFRLAFSVGPDGSSDALRHVYSTAIPRKFRHRRPRRSRRERRDDKLLDVHPTLDALTKSHR